MAKAPPKCGAPSWSAHGSKEQWWECRLPAGHEPVHLIDVPVPIIDEAGKLLGIATTPTTIELATHEYVPVKVKPAKAM